jgi:hypothetical protein
MRNLTALVAAAGIVFALTAVPAQADQAAALKAMAKSKIITWAQDPKVVAAIKAQNTKHASLDQASIIKLDKQWRAETSASSKPMINGILSNDLSAFLKGVKGKNGALFTEIFVMDNKGLNVGQSDITSDYWQGDEAKWKKSYGAGMGAVHVGKIKQDESTQKFQSQVSVAISDGGKVIGAVTVGINVDEL